MKQPQKKMRFKKPTTSLVQWNEGAGEYETKCGACGTMLYAPTLKDIHHTFSSHTKSKECLGGY